MEKVFKIAGVMTVSLLTVGLGLMLTVLAFDFINYLNEIINWVVVLLSLNSITKSPIS